MLVLAILVVAILVVARLAVVVVVIGVMIEFTRFGLETAFLDKGAVQRPVNDIQTL